MKKLRWFALLVLFPLIAACGGEVSPQPAATLVFDDGEALRRVTATSPAFQIEQPTPTEEAQPLPTSEQTETQLPEATRQPITPSGQYAIDRVSSSEQGALSDVALRLISAAVDGEALILRIAFQNKTERAFEIIGDGLNPDHVRLTDAAGATYSPRALDANFERLDPPDGFAPGGANVGEIHFPLPNAAGPLTLSLAPLGYQPITFEMTQPLVITPVVEGEYTVDLDLYSDQEVLADIALSVRQLTLDERLIRFDVAFVNQGFLGIDLTDGLNGFDAWLLDADGGQYRPIEVSDSLQASIDPLDGWRAGEANSGFITFPRPAASSELRFIFREYSPLNLQFDAGGLANAAISSATGGEAPPRPTPRPEIAQRGELQQLLDRQAAALQNGDVDSFVQTFTPALQSEVTTLAQRQAKLPLQALSIRLDPEFEPAVVGDRFESIAVDYTYHLAGIDDNPFVFTWRYTFDRDAQGWQVTQLMQPELPPYWIVDDFDVAETPHFLLLIRPVDFDDLEALSAEVEAAYQTLTDHGLELEKRYLVLLASTQAEFQLVTGQTDSRLLGLAFNRYLFNDRAVQSTNRAFALNDEAFSEFSAERQATVTHELVHLALAKSTRPFTPPWLSEGAAVYYAGQLETGGQLRSAELEQIDLRTLTEADILGEHEPTRVNAEYTFSGASFAYLVDSYGEQAVRDFYASYADVPVDTIRSRLPDSLSGAEADRVFREFSLSLTQTGLSEYFGLTIEQLDRAVKEQLAE